MRIAVACAGLEVAPYFAQRTNYMCYTIERGIVADGQNVPTLEKSTQKLAELLKALEVDTVIEAIGQSSNKVLLNAWPELKTNRRGYIEANEETGGATSIEGVYAGGDIVTGAATVILAMGAGKKAAQAIDEYLTAKAGK